MAEDACLGKAWGVVASSVPDAAKCISDCRERFMRSLVPEYEALESVCKALSDNNDPLGGGQKFDAIYCCDSQLCGVNNLDGAGQDPNINWIINACQDIGYRTIIDPGPPSPAYICPDSLFYGEDSPCQAQDPAITAKGADGTPTPSGFIAEGFGTVLTGPQMPAITTTMPGSGAGSSTIPSVHGPSLAATDVAKSRNEQGDGTRRLSDGVKAAIALSAVVGIIAVIALLAWHMRLRAQCRSRRRVSSLIKPASFLEPTESPIPLMTPSSSHTGPPLTPPPRLQERRFLLPKALSRPSRCSRRSQDWPGVPLLPLYPQAASKLDRNGGRSVIAFACEGRPLTSPAGLVLENHPFGGSLSGIVGGGGGGGSSNSSTSAIKAASKTSTETAQHRQSSATATDFARPSRVYEAPPVVVGLASPGPPPNKALPSTPSDGRASPMASPLLPLPPVANPMRRSDFGATPGTALYGSAQEPCELYSSVDKPGELRNSSSGGRNSSGAGGNAPGASPLSPRRVRHVRSPLLNEVDLRSVMRQ